MNNRTKGILKLLPILITTGIILVVEPPLIIYIIALLLMGIIPAALIILAILGLRDLWLDYQQQKTTPAITTQDVQETE